MTTFTPSTYQRAIFDFITHGTGNAVVNAVAGSGKTTTMLEALRLIPSTKNVLFLAFNRSIKLEIEKRVKALGLKNVKVSTCHGFGLGAILRDSVNEPKIDNLKYTKLMRAILDWRMNARRQKLDDLGIILKEGNKTTPAGVAATAFAIDWTKVENIQQYCGRVVKLANLSRVYLAKGVARIEEIAKKHSISLEDKEATLAARLIDMGNTLDKVIDYADMIWLPYHKNLRTRKYDFVFVDECQDLNTAQRELMRRALTSYSRFVAVGDRHQAIYGFAGADSESFDKLTELPNTTTLPLSVCYRCAANIVNTAAGIVPQIEARDGAADGTVAEVSIKTIKDGDMVLCRNTYPLVKLCLLLLRQGRKATVKGGAIGASITKMVTDCREADDMSKVFDKLYHNLEQTAKRIMRADKCEEEDALASTEYINQMEKINVIEAITKKGDTVSDVIRFLARLFDERNGDGIILSTIHRSKGLEADRVFILTGKGAQCRQPWEYVQESNLEYVAITRAKSLLGFVMDFNAYDDTDDESRADDVSPIIESRHVGEIGERVAVRGEITAEKYVASFETTVYTITSDAGNVFEKWGDRLESFVEGDGALEVGARVACCMRIKKHANFGGVNINAVSTLSRWNAKVTAG